MKCFLCQTEIVYQSDDFKFFLSKDNAQNFTEVSRTNFACLSCQDLFITIDFPGEELISFQVYLGSGYTIKGNRDDVIHIINSKGKEDKKVSMPWVSCAGTENIILYLQNLSEKYEIFVTFS